MKPRKILKNMRAKALPSSIVILLVISTLTTLFITGPYVQTAHAAKGDFSNYKTITIESDYVNTPLTNFVVLVHDTNDTWKTNETSFSFFQPDNTTECNWELEYFNYTTGTITCWVNISAVSASTDTTFYIYYDTVNSSDGGENNPTGTWHTDYVAVYHCDDTMNDVTDSTANSHTLSEYGTVAYNQTGIAGSCVSLNDGNFTEDAAHGVADTPSSTDELCIEMWSNFSGWVHDDYIYFWGCYGGTSMGLLRSDPNDSPPSLEFYTHTGAASKRTAINTTCVNGTWYYWVTSTNGTHKEIFLNGTAQGAFGPAYDSIADNVDQKFMIGQRTDVAANNYIGKVDELRISSVDRNASYVKATYYSINSPGLFLTLSGADPPEEGEWGPWSDTWTISTSHSCSPTGYTYGNWSEFEFFDGGTFDDLWTEANTTEWYIADHSAWWAGNHTYEVNTSGPVNSSFALFNSSGNNRSQMFGWVHCNDTQTDAIYPFIIFAYNTSQDFDCVMWSSTEAWVLNWNGTNMTDISTGAAVVAPSVDATDLSNQWVQEGVYLTDQGNYYKLIYNRYNGSLKFKWWDGSSFLTEPTGWCIELEHTNITKTSYRCHGIGMWNPNGRETTLQYDMMNIWQLNYTVNASSWCNISGYNESRPHMDFPVLDLGTWTEEIMSYFNATAEGNVSLATIARVMKDNITNPMNMESRAFELASRDNGQQNDTVYYYSILLDNFTSFSESSYDEWLHLHIQMTPEDDIETSEYGDFIVGIDVDNNRQWDVNDRIYWAYLKDDDSIWNQTYNGNGGLQANIANWNLWESADNAPGNLHRYTGHLNYAISIPLADLVKTGGEALNSSDIFGLSIVTTTSGVTRVTQDACIWQNWNETTEDVYYTEENNFDNVVNYFFNETLYTEGPLPNATTLGRWGEGEIGTGLQASGEVLYDVTIEKISNISSVANGSTYALINYSIWVNNTGSGPLTNIVVNDTKFNCSCHDFNETAFSSNIPWHSITNHSCHRLFNTSTLAIGGSWHIWYTVNLSNCSGVTTGTVRNNVSVNATELTSAEETFRTISWGSYATRLCVYYTTGATDVGSTASTVFSIIGIVLIIGSILALIGIISKFNMW